MLEGKDFSVADGEELTDAEQKYIASTELNADLIGHLLSTPGALARLRARNKNIFNRLKAFIQSAHDNSTSKEGKKALNKVLKSFDKALEASHGGVLLTDLRDDEEKENTEQEHGVGDERFSIKHIPQKNISYVSIQINDISGEGIQPEDSLGRKARIFLRQKFNGVVLPLGKTKNTYIRKEGINEYTNPAKEIDNEIYREKMLASTELDNLLSNAIYLGWKNDDGRHPGVLRWINYKTLFLVKDSYGTEQVLSGIVRIKRIQRGDCFYDITKIENITDGDIGQSILRHAAESVSDVSNNSIPENSENVNSDERNSKKAEGRGVTWSDLEPDITVQAEDNSDIRVHPPAPKKKASKSTESDKFLV